MCWIFMFFCVIKGLFSIHLFYLLISLLNRSWVLANSAIVDSIFANYLSVFEIIIYSILFLHLFFWLSSCSRCFYYAIYDLISIRGVVHSCYATFSTYSICGLHNSLYKSINLIFLNLPSFSMQTLCPLHSACFNDGCNVILSQTYFYYLSFSNNSIVLLFCLQMFVGYSFYALNFTILLGFSGQKLWSGKIGQETKIFISWQDSCFHFSFDDYLCWL